MKSEIKLVVLQQDDIMILMRDINGQGGFQSLLKAIRKNMRGNILLLTPSLKRKMLRYATKYGSGGFQQRLNRILEAAERSEVN